MTTGAGAIQGGLCEAEIVRCPAQAKGQKVDYCGSGEHMECSYGDAGLDAASLASCARRVSGCSPHRFDDTKHSFGISLAVGEQVNSQLFTPSRLRVRMVRFQEGDRCQAAFLDL